MGSQTQDNFKRQMKEIENRTNIVWRREKYYNEYDGKWYVRYYNRDGVLLRVSEMKSSIGSFFKGVFKVVGLGILTLIVLSVVSSIINPTNKGTSTTKQASIAKSKLKFTLSKTLVEFKIGDKVYKNDYSSGAKYRDNNGELYIPYYQFIAIVDIYNNGYTTNKNDGRISTYYTGTIVNANPLHINSTTPELFKFVEVQQISSDNPRVASKKLYTIYSKDKSHKVTYEEGGYTINGMSGYLTFTKCLQELGISSEYDSKNDILLLIIK